MLVSVVVAAYNVEKYLDRCIKSLVNQTLNNEIEIIIVNDCSEDNTLSIAKKYSYENENIIIINKEENQGLSEARNSGLALARGKYVAFVDGDDYVEINAYKSCYDYMETNNLEMAVFESTYDRTNGDKIYMKINSSQDLFRGDEVKTIYFKEMIGALPNAKTDMQIGFSPWGRMYKRSVLTENNLKFQSEREILYEDLFFALDTVGYLGSVGILHEPFYHYCENRESLTRKINPKRYDRVKNMYNYLKKNDMYYDMLFLDEETNLRFRRTMIAYIRLCIMQLSTDKQCKQCIDAVISDDVCEEVFKRYPYQKLPFKQGFFCYLIQNKFKKLVYLMTKWHMRNS